MRFLGFSRKLSLLAIVVIVVLVASNAYLLLRDVAPSPKTTSAPATLEKFKAYSGGATWEATFLIIDAGKDKGIWAKYGLDPEWGDPIPGVALGIDGKQQVEKGFKIGFSASAEVPLARANGAPVKIVAGLSGKSAGNSLYVKADSPYKTVKDLDGKKIGVASFTNPEYRNTLWIANKFGIKPDLVRTGNLTNSVVQLKLGKLDAFYSFSTAALRLADSGELRVLVRLADFQTTPWVGVAIWVAEDLIEKNPEFVQRFVKATLEIVRHLKESPAYAVELYQKKTNAPRDFALRAVSEIDYKPEGRGEGADLVAAVTNSWQFNKASGAIPADVNVKIEDAVDLRFLP